MKPIVDLDSVTLARDGREILGNVTFTIHHGEHWALLGPNGCGKTTLLRILAGYLWPTDGRVCVLGDEYGHVNIQEKRRSLGMVSSALFERIPPRDTFLDVVLSGRFGSLGIYDEPTDDDRSRASSIISFLGCSRLTERPYSVLSFGERQCALIARALMAAPKILMLDEPCEGLDISNRERVITFIDSLISGPEPPTIIYVTHRIEEISPGITHAAVMKDGSIIARGKKEEVLTASTLRRALGVPVGIRHHNGRMYAYVR